MVFGCKQEPLPTVADVSLERYVGTWYEIARLPNSFEKGLKCITANYSLREDGKITVVNQGYKIDNPSKLDRAEGVARVPDAAKPGELKVSFFWPFEGDYFIIELDEDYNFVLVGSPSRKYLWILSRSQTMDPTIYNGLTAKANGLGFDTSAMIKVQHDCDKQ